MENLQLNQEGKEIKLKRALILGNFYQRKVKIIRAINQGYETIVDTIVGLKHDFVITRDGRSIPKSSIKIIYQI
ncbi:hypothetical protein FNH22_04485 [Fulvivirga sp. M361]|uniref:hypothetical protein n=1 Tax=Fulvivirga sp. M361 TaxID=2594266 RepID=UPI00117A2478|nr:hypothetical protein [Fulvivirga sp. M361]TRX61318.1 hypothetical protein FNH22_04485 [Fulvivirga sp. M361]